ncbi:nucleolar MIF4G domain-containing protein 1 isoform X1 [Saccopteryx bilineata]|uniref:nucleolar MIF4G domain-containing protein 1 isoform X1 n=1 Tax=Saccopteryx bilineata TaxID=59482 RepID=UPI00338E5DD4
MAASTGAGSSERSGFRRRVARGKRGGGRGHGSGGVGPLKRLKLAVEEFVQATCQGEASGGREERRAERRARPGGRKSCKDLRKENRQLRKARRLQRTAGPAQGRGSGAGATSGPPAEGAGGRGGGSSPRLPRTPPPPRPAAAHAARIRALLAANQEEDREIRKLERCLGLNKRRKKGDASSVPLSFARDGLDYILGALGSGGRSGLCDSSSEDGEDGYAVHESDVGSDTGEQSDGNSDAKEESDADIDTEDHQQAEQEEKRKKAAAEGRAKEKWEEKKVCFAEDEERSENSSEDVGTADQSLCEDGKKYIPPHIRRAEETVDAQKREERERLRKHVQGLINRLSELNMASISGQLEELYMAHSRKDMNDTLTGVLLSACAPGMTMPSRLVMEHVLLVSILHCTVGIEVGAHFLEAVVRKFDAIYTQGHKGKECDNLFTIIAHLYNFHVVQSLLIFDVLKKLIKTFTEKDIELILLMLRNVGFSLRKDDALSLKELIAETQAKASGAGSRFQDQTRIRFMLETMLALKNNDMRKIPGYDPEPVEKLRKLQRTLVRGAGSGAETQLRVSWDGILNAEQTGRWWIVGSAWSGTPMINSSQQKSLQKPLAGTVSAKILELARKQRMNTNVRRNIFCTIMTSEDFLDTFEKLLKLGLKDQQEREIVHVLMDCCLQEKMYNPFYAFLASKFCDYERRFQMTFQFSIWDKFRDLENLPATNFSNLVHLVAHLLKTKSLPLSILKVVEFSELDKPRVHFLRKVLSMLLMETEVEDLSLIFMRVSNNPKLGVLREGLKLFISHFLLKSAQAHHSAEEASTLRERAELTTRTLQGRASLRM